MTVSARGAASAAEAPGSRIAISSPPTRPAVSPAEERAAKSLGHRAEVFVSREKPVGVVQGLEVVEPDDEERERPSEEVRAGDLALELEVKLLAVREARERVGGLGHGVRRVGAKLLADRSGHLARRGEKSPFGRLRGEARRHPEHALARLGSGRDPDLEVLRSPGAGRGLDEAVAPGRREPEGRRSSRAPRREFPGPGVPSASAASFARRTRPVAVEESRGVRRIDEQGHRTPHDARSLPSFADADGLRVRL